jgi:putative sterol carrier protein
VSEPPNQTVAEFFDGLGGRGHEPLVGKATGTARFDVVDGKRTERWLVTIVKGDIRVSRRNAAADCVVRADKASFDRAVVGELNFLAAVLRGEVVVEGDPKLLVLLQRLFPRPSDRRRRRPSSSARRKQ